MFQACCKDAGPGHELALACGLPTVARSRLGGAFLAQTEILALAPWRQWRLAAPGGRLAVLRVHLDDIEADNEFSSRAAERESNVKLLKTHGMSSIIK